MKFNPEYTEPKLSLTNS